MPTAEVKLRDGRTLEFKIKEGTSEEEVAAAVEEFLANEQKGGTPVSPKVATPTKKDTGVGGFLGGMGTEIAVSTAGKYGAAALGGTIGSAVPIVGTAVGAGIGYTVGAIGSGIAGSIAAQKVEGYDTVNWGRAIAAGVINLIPGAGIGAIKTAGSATGKGLLRASEKAIKYGAIEGAITGAAEAQIESVINKRELAGIGTTATYAAFGTAFGGAFGALGKKLTAGGRAKLQAEDEIREGVNTNRITKKEISENVPADPSETNYQVERSRAAADSENAAEQVTKFKYDPNQAGWLTKLYNRMPQSAKEFIAKVTPSVVSRQIADKALDYQNIIKLGDAIGGRAAAAISRVIQKNPANQASIDKFFDTGVIDNVLRKDEKIADVLTEWKNFVKQQQKILINQLDNDMIEGMDDEARMLLAAEIRRSLEEGDYLAREYRMFTDDKFIPDLKKREKAIKELEAQLDKGKTFAYGTEQYDAQTGQFSYERTIKTSTLQEDARIDMSGVPLKNRKDYVEGESYIVGAAEPKKTNREIAEETIDALIAKSAYQKAGKRAGAPKQPIDSPIRARGLDPSANAALMDMMGVIGDSAERARGTVTRLTRMVARHNTDSQMGNMLEEMGMASRDPQTMSSKGYVQLDSRGGNMGLYAPKEVSIAFNQLYASDFIEKSADGFQGFWTALDTGIGLGKAVKVLGNLPSYMVQVYGNVATLAQLGINPFDAPALMKGMRVALSDADFFEGNHKLSKKILTEIQDAERYGLKGGNIFASDIRSNLDNGLDPVKGLVQPFASAYQVPDTAFRFYGWKAMQKKLKRIYPELAEEARSEDLKNIAAKLINDVYQNYDKVNPFLRKTTKFGITPQFATFTMELIRNQYNQGRQIKDLFSGTLGRQLGFDLGPINKSASYLEGVTRLASSTAVLGGGAAAIKAWQTTHGVNEETETMLTDSYVEDYAQNSPNIYELDAEKGTFNYMNSSYLIPQNMLTQAFKAGFDGSDETSLAAMVRQEFIGEGAFFYKGLMNAVRNQVEGNKGEKITTNPNDIEAFFEIFEYTIEDIFKPGQAREVDKFIKATNPDSIQGIDDVLQRQIGIRRNARNLEQAGTQRARERYVDVRENKLNWAQQVKYNASELSLLPDSGESMYQEMNKQYQDSFKIIARDYRNYVTMHGTDVAVDMLKRAGVSSYELAYLQAGGKLPSIPRDYIPSTEEKLSALGLDLQTNSVENNKEISAAIRGIADPIEKKKAANYFKNLRKKQARGLTTFESTVKGLDSLRQIQLLQDLFANNIAYYRELAGKGVLKKDAIYKLLR